MLWIHMQMIQGSRDQLAFDQSPGLIAVFHALPRLLAPRHPPHALSSLAALILSSKVKHVGLTPRRSPNLRLRIRLGMTLALQKRSLPATWPSSLRSPSLALRAHGMISNWA